MDAIISAVVAAAVSIAVVYLTRRSETMKPQESLRAAAYVDFIRGVAGLEVLQRDSLRDESHFREGRTLLMLVADAKARIAIYGGAGAVASLPRFLRGGAVLDTPERAGEFTRVCREFRNDGRPKLDDVSDEDIHFLLFGIDPKQYL